MKYSISILGSTGSVGITTLKLLDKKKNLFNIHLLLANKNFKEICFQIKKYSPKYFVISDLRTYLKVKQKFKKKKIKILNNLNSFKEYKKIDFSVTAIPGIAGLDPTLFITKKSKKILIANKESIICGWNLIKSVANKYNSRIIPLDSEHFSIMKLLENQNMREVKKIYITASGGPFLNYKYHQLKKVKPIDALKHPKWKMGKKITIDSSTLMNKIFELVEAQYLFKIPNNKIDITIHPDSLVHAIIFFNNGLTKFIYHETSMMIPIANAIFEKNLKIDDFIVNSKKGINKFSLKNLTFEKVNTKIFPLIKLKKRINEYPSTPIIVNAANEILVDHFLQKKIPFLSINKFIMAILKDSNYKKNAIKKPKNIKEIYKIDFWARSVILKKIKN